MFSKEKRRKKTGKTARFIAVKRITGKGRKRKKEI